MSKAEIRDELPSVLLLIICYSGVAAVTFFADHLYQIVAAALLIPLIVLHSSLQHEFIHGHPTRSEKLNDLLVFPAVGLFVPFQRFKDTHLAHHYDPNLTDPYDDPESNYVDPMHWNKMPRWLQKLARFNNTLFGRMTVGPLLTLVNFYRADLEEIMQGDRRIFFSYVQHFIGLMPVAIWLHFASNMPIWTYVVCAYLALSILKIRTFLEHKADERAASRSVLIEDRGLLALLFLNNNYHALHHACPRVVWHRLPHIFKQRREALLRRNGGYWFKSYWSVFYFYLFKAKDPVPHPLMEMPQAEDAVSPDKNPSSVTSEKLAPGRA